MALPCRPSAGYLVPLPQQLEDLARIPRLSQSRFGSFLPRFGASAYQLDDFIDALSHLLMSPASAAFAPTMNRKKAMRRHGSPHMMGSTTSFHRDDDLALV
jgi:hypothetical protein